jgi:transposase
MAKVRRLGAQALADVGPHGAGRRCPSHPRRQERRHLRRSRRCLDAFEKIGEDVTEVVECRPASLMVARVIKPKFVRKDRDRRDAEVFVGETPELPIPRGLAGPGLLADTLVRRWQDNQPLHRLEGIFARRHGALAPDHVRLAPRTGALGRAARRGDAAGRVRAAFPVR